MIKQIILLTVIIILIVYIILKSIVFYLKNKVSPIQFLHIKGIESTLWLFFMLSILLYLLHASLFYLGITQIWFSNIITDLIGYVLLILGLIILIISHAQMGKSWRMGNDQKNKFELVKKGIFSISRNPIYLGIILLGISAFILAPTPLSLALALFLIINFNLIIRLEEKFLEKKLGKSYLDYKKKIRRFI
ncbi:isoprenylcysteine carboxylmethyltransferase family protein [Candidatus Woesearchaeota archaeon]|nr:isoprenylcysteine carboxylmethyltransferase family protein [Candidatus Woesearchaeota archaeon]